MGLQTRHQRFLPIKYDLFHYLVRWTAQSWHVLKQASLSHIQGKNGLKAAIVSRLIRVILGYSVNLDHFWRLMLSNGFLMTLRDFPINM